MRVQYHAAKTFQREKGALMGFLEDMQETLDRGVSTARGAVSGVAVEQLGFVKSFVRTCHEGWLQGWHEANGGNMSYRMTESDVSAARTFFYDEPGSWVSAGMQAQCLAGARFLVTRAGGHFRTMQADPSRGVGIIEMDSTGSAWRVVWGFKDGGRPTSEIGSHLMAHAMRMAATGSIGCDHAAETANPAASVDRSAEVSPGKSAAAAGGARVIYHAHMPNLAALTLAGAFNSRSLTRLLWKTTTECVMAVPTGVGVVGTVVPGSPELARATSDLMKDHAAVLWVRHGLIVAGETLDEAFGLAHSLEKAAGIYLAARAACGGQEPPCLLSDEELAAVIAGCGIPANEAYR